MVTHPNCLHTFWGAYIPGGGVEPDRKGLGETGEREIFEETQFSVDIDQSLPILLSHEVTTGFIQLVFLGVNVQAEALEKAQGNWEGLCCMKGPLRL